jgi:hypothetical protein
MVGAAYTLDFCFLRQRREEQHRSLQQPWGASAQTPLPLQALPLLTPAARKPARQVAPSVDSAPRQAAHSHARPTLVPCRQIKPALAPILQHEGELPRHGRHVEQQHAAVHGLPLEPLRPKGHQLRQGHRAGTDVALRIAGKGIAQVPMLPCALRQARIAGSQAAGACNTWW